MAWLKSLSFSVWKAAVPLCCICLACFELILAELMCTCLSWIEIRSRQKCEASIDTLDQEWCYINITFSVCLKPHRHIDIGLCLLGNCKSVFTWPFPSLALLPLEPNLCWRYCWTCAIWSGSSEVAAVAHWNGLDTSEETYRGTQYLEAARDGQISTEMARDGQRQSAPGSQSTCSLSVVPEAVPLPWPVQTLATTCQGTQDPCRCKVHNIQVWSCHLR